MSWPQQRVDEPEQRQSHRHIARRTPLALNPADEASGIFRNRERRKVKRYIVSCLPGQLFKTPEIIGLAAGDIPPYAVFAAIVCREREMPVVEFVIQLSQIPDGRFGGPDRIAALVDPEGTPETVYFSRRCDELPDS